MLRALMAPVSAMRWSRYLAAFHARVGAPEPVARVLSKPLRRYLHRSFWPHKRVSVLMESYDWLEAQFAKPFLRRFCANEDSQLVAIEARKNSVYGLYLTAAVNATLQREGEISIYCARSPRDEKLCRAAFSIVGAGGKKTLVIGGIQGPSADHKRAVIDATRELYGLRPKDAVLLAIRAFAAAAGIAEVHAVSDANHVLSRLNNTSKFSNYDAYWLERGARAGRPFGYVFEPLALGEPDGSKRDAVKFAIVAAVADFVRGNGRQEGYSPWPLSAAATSSSTVGSSIVAGIAQES
jgi:uncharacterized protein VirK/YbjX